MHLMSRLSLLSTDQKGIIQYVNENFCKDIKI